MSSAKTSPMRQLVEIISAQVSEIEAIFEKQGIEYPNLDDPFVFGQQEIAATTPDVSQHAALVVAACNQLSTTLSAPGSTLFGISAGVHVASALRVALDSNTVEILRGYPEGLGVTEIAAQNGLDPVRLARILRILATYHIFIETSPNVFKNNRLSSIMDTMKSVEEIKAKPEDKHAGTLGLAALIQHTTDEMFKGSAFLSEVLNDPILGHSEDPDQCALAMGLNMKKPFWEWYEEPGNVHRQKRFGVAMNGSTKLEPPNAIDLGFKWGNLAPGSVIVDVGGGLGHITMKLFQLYPNLKYVIQDRQPVIEQGREYWKETLPSALDNGSVELQVHDFFSPQPVTNATIFLCRMVLHDYGRTKASSILQHLRKAANQDTKLILVDAVIPYACADDTETVTASIPGAKQPPPPKPLLANLGKAKSTPYLADLQMMIISGEERTLGTWIELTLSTGWKIVEIFPVPGSMHQQILAVPV